MFSVPEKYRVTTGPMASSLADNGNNGLFCIPNRDIVPRSRKAHTWTLIASDGMGWEHVSISHPIYTPSWRVMCAVKGLFWSGEDAVVQFHPPKSEYVNNHENCLHLWRPEDGKIPTPPSILVGLTKRMTG